MFDVSPVAFAGPGREWKAFKARWTGNTTSVPTPVQYVPAAAPTQLAITRSGVGTCNVSVVNVPVGVCQNYDFWISSPVGSANSKNVLVTPPTAGVNLWQLKFVWANNGVAVDLATTEELQADLWFANYP